MRNPLVSILAASLLLSACATDGAFVRNERNPPAASLESMMADAERHVQSGQHERAYAVLKHAGASFPSEKAPWIQMAQMKFDKGSYGDAIVFALEGLQRDPSDRQGNSIVVVGGLRLSTRALADLSQQNNIGGPLRSEAQELARLLRASLGEDVLVPASGKPAPKRPLPPAKPAAPVKPSTSSSTSADPFGALK